MSMEIKFRAWSKFPKMFLDMDDACYYLLPHGKLMQITRNNQKPDTHREIDAVVQLYTGLKDCKGVEIYEGDIVERSTFDLKKGDYTRKSEVHFLEGSFCIYTEDWFSQPLSDDIAKECKVIGNIYENPQLLGEQK